MDRSYAVLHLTPSASADEIRQAYLDLVRVWHPDRFASDGRLRQIAENKLKEITEAYRALCAAEPPQVPYQSYTPAASPAASGLHQSHFVRLALWGRVAGVAVLLLGFLFSTRYIYESLAAPFRRTGFGNPDFNRSLQMFYPNPAFAAYGVDGRFPWGMERLANRFDVAAPILNSRSGGAGSTGPSGPTSRSGNAARMTPIGLGEFVVLNQTDQDCIVRVFGRFSASPVGRDIRLMARGETRIPNLPPDIYRLRVSFSGKEPRDYWVGPYQFFEIETAQGKRGESYTVTLKGPQEVP